MLNDVANYELLNFWALGRITLDGALADLAERGSSWGQMVLGILSMTTLGLVDTRVWQTFLKQQIVEEQE